MKDEDIIRMARAVDPVTALLLDRKAPQGMEHETFVWFLERFAALVAAAERDRMCELFGLSKELARESAKGNEAD